MPSAVECQSDPIKNEEWGWDAPTQIDAGTDDNEKQILIPDPILSYTDQGTEYHICRHPYRFLSNTINYWFEQYQWDGKNAFRYADAHPCYVDAVGLYEYYYSFFGREVRGNG